MWVILLTSFLYQNYRQSVAKTLEVVSKLVNLVQKSKFYLDKWIFFSNFAPTFGVLMFLLLRPLM